MTVKTILPFGDPILRKKAKPVGSPAANTIKLLGDLAETLYAEEGRAGLAAPQIGIMRRVAVLDCGGGLVELIDPEIIESRGEQTGPETCLSFPGFAGLVKRADYVKIKSLDREGQTVYFEGEGYLSRCFQHEIDHLDGVLFIDRMQDNVLYNERTQRKISRFDAIRLAGARRMPI